MLRTQVLFTTRSVDEGASNYSIARTAHSTSSFVNDKMHKQTNKNYKGAGDAV